MRSLDALHAALDDATDLRSLKFLNDQAALIKEMARRMGVAFEGQNRFAEMELRAARKLGEVLRADVHPGGRRSNSRRGSSIRGGSSAPLPEWISWNKSSRCQKLAAIPDDAFEKYIADSKARHKRITQTGLLHGNSAGRVPTRSRKRMRDVVEAESLPPVWNAIGKAMDVSIAVGISADIVGAAEALELDNAPLERLRGNVVVKADDRVEEWLSKLSEARRSGSVAEAVVVFNASTREPWFRLLDQQEWMCGFVQRGSLTSATVVAYLGEQPRAMALALARLGAVLRGIASHNE